MPLALGAEICYCAKYLGFFVGPCARGQAWDAPCRKLPKRARHIKTLRLSLTEAVLALCVFAFSVIRFTLQLVPLSLVLIWHFGLALDICTYLFASVFSWGQCALFPQADGGAR